MSIVLPDWLPIWALVLLAGLAAVLAIAFLLMPFAVFGVKGRLAEIELQLEDVRADLRVIAMRVGSLVPETSATNREAAVAPRREEWVPPPSAPAPADPEFRPAAPRTRTAGMAPSPLLPPDILETKEPPFSKANESTSEDPSEQAFPRTETPHPAQRATPSPATSPVPRVSDAYEPRVTRPHEPRMSAEEPLIGLRTPLGRMPWHETEPRPEPRRPAPRPENEADGGRTEPVLRWPSRRNEQDPA
ncbi:hypothetical protein [Acetobacter estunensis]|uniref:hypothetical protein n=1 Tax=Acetobacter estunensis TaxID=104097 RepID=UPI001C2D0278|nr:hypothetical protein [Acetobacter estunensis]MBV1836170.1 hypothetical protein [Acetobacter estunensis]